MSIFSRLKNNLTHAWNVFNNLENRVDPKYTGASYGFRPDRTRTPTSNEKSIITSIYVRMSTDAAAIDIRHARADKDGAFLEMIDSGLDNCLTVEANIDQAARAFRQDAFMSMFNNGHAAIVPVETTINPAISGSFDIKNMRVGEVVAWYPREVRVSVYNDDPEKGIREEIVLPKTVVAIAENPFYGVMNEPNSTLKRLIRKLNLLDVVDEQSSSGKLDIIIQLPYTIKSEARRAGAEQRRTDLEAQLSGSKYGIAYADATEKIVQLNRPAENNLLKQIEYLVKLLYSQLGLTPEVMDGTADEATMLNYNNRTIEPLVAAVAEAMKRTFITKTGRSQGQTIMYFRDPFRLVPLSEIAEITDKLTRNEVLTANEIRPRLGFKPSKDPKADELRNSNMPQPNETPTDSTPPSPTMSPTRKRVPDRVGSNSQ